MNKVLNDRSEDIAAAMRGLCDAVGNLAMVRDDLMQGMKGMAPGSADELITFKINRTIERLIAAAAVVPDECWAIMLTGDAVGGHEIHRRVETMIRNTVIINNVAQGAAA